MNEERYFDEMGALRAYPVTGCICYLLGIIAIGVVLMLLTACSTQYVPVETVHEYVHHQTDSFFVTDSVIKERETIVREVNAGDSLLLAKLGLKVDEQSKMLLVLQRELAREKTKETGQHTDTIIKTDSIRVPYPVEREISAWERTQMASTGFVAAIFIVAAVLMIRWLRRRYKRI